MSDAGEKGRFFNNPEIERTLGLQKKDEQPGPEPGQRWYSICSAHQRHDPDCATCQVGHWHTPSEKDQEYWDKMDVQDALDQLQKAVDARENDAYGAMLYDDEFP